MKKIFLFTDADLDGAGCALVYRWLVNKDVIIIPSTTRTIRGDLLKLISTHGSDKNIDVTICDIDCSKAFEIVDKTNFTIIDHHETHLDVKYNHAKTVIRPYSSATKLLYDILKDKTQKTITKNQEALIKLIDDFDSYALKSHISVCLNNIFWGYTGNKVQKFIDDFDVGFFTFSDFHKNMLAIHIKKVKEKLENAPIFAARLKIGQKTYNVLSTVSDYAINEVADYFLNKYDGDFIMVLNLNRGTVCFRKSPQCELHLGRIAQKLADGGGHAYASGGSITDKIISLTKKLQAV